MSSPDDPPADRRQLYIAGLTLAAIAVHLILRYGTSFAGNAANVPLWIAYVFGGMPLVWGLLGNLLRREFGSDLLAGLSIATSVFLGEYLAGALVILMLSGGEALEAYAVSSASSVLKALAKRMPSVAHRKAGTSFEEIALDEVAVGDLLEVLPHEICPVDGTVVEGRGVMDESYLTGEPYQISKTPGSTVISGALNGESSLTIRADKLAIDSRYSKIMEVMRDSEERRPKMRRLADQLGAWYTPIAVLIALGAWLASGDPVRFLAVLVVATPCPLLIAIPVSIIGSIALAAKRAIIVRDPGILETIDSCRSVIFDKTGTLTYGRPEMTSHDAAPGVDPGEVLRLIASVEVYSKHPLAEAIVEAAKKEGKELVSVDEISEKPGQGLAARVQGREVLITNRKRLAELMPEEAALLPEIAGGLECVVLLDGHYAATFRFRDEPRGRLPRRPRRDHDGPCGEKSRGESRDRAGRDQELAHPLRRRRHQRRARADGGDRGNRLRPEQRRHRQGRGSGYHGQFVAQARRAHPHQPAHAPHRPPERGRSVTAPSEAVETWEAYLASTPITKTGVASGLGSSLPGLEAGLDFLGGDVEVQGASWRRWRWGRRFSRWPGAAEVGLGGDVADHEAVAAAGEAAVGDERDVLAEALAHDGAGGAEHLAHAGAAAGPS
jgi:P-type E1-E2 ATPase